MTERRTRPPRHVTPLASIFGSGFLIIVPVLERSTGAWSPLAIAGVCALACAGRARVVRHVVRQVEPRLESGDLGRATGPVERLSDVVIVVAYVISVALYLRIMAEYVVAPSRLSAPRACGSAVIASRRRRGDRRARASSAASPAWTSLDRVALSAVLLLVLLLGVFLLVHDLGVVAGRVLAAPALDGQERHRRDPGARAAS